MTDKRLPDISEYYQGDRAAHEEAEWNRVQRYRPNLDELLHIIAQEKILSIVEIGCGSGIIATQLPWQVQYLGIDANDTFLELARKKNHEGRKFVKKDVREVTREWLQQEYGTFDMVLCLSFLKHFGLHEWHEIVWRILSLTPLALFEVQHANTDYDDGIEYHHVYTRVDFTRGIIGAAGHDIVSQKEIYRDDRMWETTYLTRRHPDELSEHLLP